MELRDKGFALLLMAILFALAQNGVYYLIAEALGIIGVILVFVSKRK